MYQKGELEVVSQRFPGYEIEDARDGYRKLTYGVYLPHSCNEWIIGGEEQVRDLIADLQAWLDSRH